MNKAILQFHKVSMNFRDADKEVKALDEVSFTLYDGDILGVIGESGSGKSTIAKLITGLHEASDGSIMFLDHDITHIKGEVQKRLYEDIQMVFQDAIGSFNPRRKIGQTIGETLCQLCNVARGSEREHVEDLLEAVGLKRDYADKFPHELSGGECQRAAVARAMAVHPRVLICDEATSALDVSAQARIIELLVHLAKAHHMTILFITHDLPLVSTITNRLLIMNKGKVEEEGDTEAIIKNPQSAYTRNLLDAVL